MRISDWSSDVCSSESGFEARTAKLVQQFDDYESIDGLHVKGELTLGENIADLGGLTVAHDALLKALADAGANAPGEIDGYTQDQLFFINWASVWRRGYNPEELKVRLNTDSQDRKSTRLNSSP